MIGITHHGELVSKLTTGLAEVGEALPRFEMSSILYNAAYATGGRQNLRTYLAVSTTCHIVVQREPLTQNLHWRIQGATLDGIVSDIKTAIESVGLWRPRHRLQKSGVRVIH